MATTYRNSVIDRYFTEIRGFRPMSNETETETFERLAKGDETARNEIINANLAFVVSRAKKWANGGDLLSDLIQAGNIGLINAVNYFDCTKGYRFISFAVYMIDQEIYKEFKTQKLVRQTNDAKLSNKVRLIRRDFFQTEEREPSAEEIAEILKDRYSIEVKDLTDIIPLSVCAFEGANNDGEEVDTLESTDLALKVSTENEVERVFDLEECNEVIRRKLQRLLPREQEIVALSFGLGCTPMENEDIAERYGLTAERVRQIIKASVGKMKGGR